jgi:hypothetical protein
VKLKEKLVDLREPGRIRRLILEHHGWCRLPLFPRPGSTLKAETFPGRKALGSMLFTKRLAAERWEKRPWSLPEVINFSASVGFVW